MGPRHLTTWTLPDGTKITGAQREIVSPLPTDLFVAVRGFSSLMLVWSAPVSGAPSGFTGWIDVANIPPENARPGFLQIGHYKTARDYLERTGKGLNWPGKLGS